MHYFDDSSLEFEPLSIKAVLGTKVEEFVSARGVFSANGLDKGTAVLLKYLNSERSQAFFRDDELNKVNILDLGCGWGAIAIALARRFPSSQIWGVDVNKNALHALSENCKKHNLKNIHALLPEEVPENLEFGALVSNPPIRIGQENLRELLSYWAKQLNETASVVMVVQKNLGSDSLLNYLSQSTFPNIEKLASSKGFRILGC
ncbi:MAG: methyltransferase [Candidatus Ancillula sp.]|nr:methyltransferase [Candidatus Ancillula sp.]